MVAIAPPTEIAVAGDSLLEPLLRAGTESARQSEIERLLVTVARPLSERILSRHLRIDSALKRHDGDDIVSTVMLRLVARLTRLRVAEEAPIHDFQNYVATLTYNTIYSFLREQFPQRTRLKNRLRYILTHDARLDLWTSDRDVICGLRLWMRGPGTGGIPSLSRQNASPTMLDERNPAPAVAAIFRTVGHALPLDALAELVAELWGVRDRPMLQTAVVADPQPSALLAMERREFVASLWKEIESLRRMQRKALLLNLRDAETVNVLGLFVATGVATMADLASVLEMAIHDLMGIWNDLPLSDVRIAELMNVSRQQVINLRKAARKRLIRRLLH